MDKKNISAIVLAGGNSSRMGQNKALLKLGSKTVIEIVVDKLKTIFNEVIIVTNTPKLYEMIKDVRFAKDLIQSNEKKSIMGLYTGIYEAKNDYVFAVACDMPFLNTDLINYMVYNIKDEDALVPYMGGYYQPLHAIYSKKSLKYMKELLDTNNYRITDLFNNIKVKKITDEDLKELNINNRCFSNMNTFEEYMNIKNAWHMKK